MIRCLRFDVVLLALLVLLSMGFVSKGLDDLVWYGSPCYLVVLVYGMGKVLGTGGVRYKEEGKRGKEGRGRTEERVRDLLLPSTM